MCPELIFMLGPVFGKTKLYKTVSLFRWEGETKGKKRRENCGRGIIYERRI